jgi:uncharacterized membrane protein YiaA
MERQHFSVPSQAFVGASWFALLLGAGAFMIGLWNLSMPLEGKGYYFTLLLYGLFAAVSVQKAVRDRMEGIQVTGIYYGLAWFSVLSALLLLFIGLWNATLPYSTRGFLGMAYALALFAAIAVQKNTRDTLRAGEGTGTGAFWRRRSEAAPEPAAHAEP